MTEKWSIRVAGHPTSISLEPEFREELRRIAEREGISLARLVSRIDAGRQGNLSSALRVFVLERLRSGG